LPEALELDSEGNMAPLVHTAEEFDNARP